MPSERSQRRETFFPMGRFVLPEVEARAQRRALRNAPGLLALADRSIKGHDRK
jgi:hypothetical protein